MDMNQEPAITLNGAPHPLASPLSLAALLASIGLAGKPVLVVRGRERVAA